MFKEGVYMKDRLLVGIRRGIMVMYSLMVLVGRD